MAGASGGYSISIYSFPRTLWRHLSSCSGRKRLFYSTSLSNMPWGLLSDCCFNDTSGSWHIHLSSVSVFWMSCHKASAAAWHHELVTWRYYVPSRSCYVICVTRPRDCMWICRFMFACLWRFIYLWPQYHVTDVQLPRAIITYHVTRDKVSGYTTQVFPRWTSNGLTDVTPVAQVQARRHAGNFSTDFSLPAWFR